MGYLFSISINKYNVLIIFWNIFLALIPCIVVFYTAKIIRNRKWNNFNVYDKIAFILIFFFWLIVLPNTAYLFLIVRHLVNYCHHFDKYRVCEEGTTWIVIFFFTYALIGLPTFYYALNKMAFVFKKVFNKLISLILPIVVIPLTIIGVMLGLFERFNSWDILIHPFNILRAGFGYFTDANLFFNYLVLTLSLYLIYYGFDYFISKIVKND